MSIGIAALLSSPPASADPPAPAATEAAAPATAPAAAATADSPAAPTKLDGAPVAQAGPRAPAASLVAVSTGPESFEGKKRTGIALLVVGGAMLVPSVLLASACSGSMVAGACWGIAGGGLGASTIHLAIGAALLGVGISSSKKDSPTVVPMVRVGAGSVEATWKF